VLRLGVGNAQRVEVSEALAAAPFDHRPIAGMAVCLVEVHAFEPRLFALDLEQRATAVRAAWDADAVRAARRRESNFVDAVPPGAADAVRNARVSHQTSPR